MNRCRHIGNTHTGRCRRSRGYSFKFRILAVIFNIVDNGFKGFKQLFRFWGIEVPVWTARTLFQILPPDFRDSLTKAHGKSLNQLLAIIYAFRIAWITIPALTRIIFVIFFCFDVFFCQTLCWLNRRFNIFFCQSLAEETHTAFFILIVSIPIRNNNFANAFNFSFTIFFT